MKWLLTAVLGLVLLAGCGSEQGTAAGGGFIAGWTLAMRQGNEAIENVLIAAEQANDKAEYLRELAEDNPEALVAAVDPNLGVEVARLLANIKAMKEKDFDWLTLALAALGIFGGGTGVNFYKNYISRKAGK